MPTKKSDLPEQLAAPAQRALAGAGIQNLKQLTKFSETESSKCMASDRMRLNSSEML